MVKYILLLSFSFTFLFPYISRSQCSTTPTTEAVRNGNFEAGYLTKSGAGHVFTANGPFDFQSDLTSTANFVANPPTGTCITSIGNMYAVAKAEPGMTCTASPRQAFAGTDYIGYPGFPKSFNDHTPGLGGNGFALIGDFEGYTGGKWDTHASGLPCIWRQRVTIYPNEKYFFSAWFANYNRDANLARTGPGLGVNYNTPTLNFVVIPMVSGVPQWAQRANIGAATPNDEMVWQQFYGQWTPTGVYTEAMILIEVQAANATNTNDLVIDDISFINGCSNLLSLPASSIPNLGAGFSLCMTNGVATLNSNVATSPTTQFWWYSGTASPQTALVTASLTANTYNISAPGTYRVCTQNAGLPAGCSASSTIVVTATMPPVVISDAVLCTSTTTTLSTSVTGTGLTYDWYKRPAGAPTSSTSSITTGVVGTYGVRVTPGPGAQAIGCPTVTSNDAVVTSNISTPSISSSNCAAAPSGSFTLTATGGGNTFTWYDAASGGTVIGTGNPVVIPITSARTVYVENSNTSTVAPTRAQANGNTGGGGATWSSTNFTALQNFTIVSIWVRSEAGGGAMTVSMTQNGSAYMTAAPQNLTVGTWTQITLNWPVSAGSNYAINFSGGGWLSVRNSFPSTGYGGLATITPNPQGNSGAAIEWTVRTGSPCLRGSISLDCGLPVTYVYFDAERAEDFALLTWATGMEKDAREFAVETSLDGQEFKAIGVVKARNLPGGATYHFETFQALNQQAYYRLRQVDLNGDDFYSPMKLVSASFVHRLVIAPNPSSGSVAITLNATAQEGNADAYLILYNSLGKQVNALVLKRSILQEGYSLDLSDLPKGVYILKVSTSQGEWMESLIRD